MAAVVLTFDRHVTNGTLNDELLTVVTLRSPNLLVAVLTLSIELCNQTPLIHQRCPPTSMQARLFAMQT